MLLRKTNWNIIYFLIFIQSNTTWADVEDVASQGRKIELPRAYEAQLKLNQAAFEQSIAAARAEDAIPLEDQVDSAFTEDESLLHDDLYELRDDEEIEDRSMGSHSHSKSTQYDLNHPDQSPKDPRTFDGIMEPLMSTPDLAQHLKQYDDLAFLPPGNISFTQPQFFEYSQYPNARNIPFLAPTDPDKFRFDQKVVLMSFFS